MCFRAVSSSVKIRTLPWSSTACQFLSVSHLKSMLAAIQRSTRSLFHSLIWLFLSSSSVHDSIISLIHFIPVKSSSEPSWETPSSSCPHHLYKWTDDRATHPSSSPHKLQLKPTGSIRWQGTQLAPFTLGPGCCPWLQKYYYSAFLFALYPAFHLQPLQNVLLIRFLYAFRTGNNDVMSQTTADRTQLLISTSDRRANRDFHSFLCINVSKNNCCCFLWLLPII